jgi:hypothetical protein
MINLIKKLLFLNYFAEVKVVLICQVEFSEIS